MSLDGVGGVGGATTTTCREDASTFRRRMAHARLMAKLIERLVTQRHSLEAAVKSDTEGLEVRIERIKKEVEEEVMRRICDRIK